MFVPCIPSTLATPKVVQVHYRNVPLCSSGIRLSTFLWTCISQVIGSLAAGRGRPEQTCVTGLRLSASVFTFLRGPSPCWSSLMNQRRPCHDQTYRLISACSIPSRATRMTQDGDLDHYPILETEMVHARREQWCLLSRRLSLSAIPFMQWKLHGPRVSLPHSSASRTRRDEPQSSEGQKARRASVQCRSRDGP